MRKLILFSSLVPLLLSCGKQHRSVSADQLFAAQDSVLELASDYPDTVEIRYARGLGVTYRPDGIHIRISDPDPSASGVPPEEIVIRQPARRFICTTALQLGNFEVLGLEDCVVGINSLRNLFSPVMRERIGKGSTLHIGKEGNFDVEAILTLRPDFIFVSASKHGGFELLRETGITLIPHHGYKETDPLGQAEWIKLVGVLTGEARRANAVFADLERKYLTLRDEVAALNEEQPSVASGRQIRDGWYVVGGRSYMARLFADAGARYVMADNTDSGGLTLDFEAAYARSVHTDFWQTDGSFGHDFSLSDLAAEDARYTTLDAYRRRQVLFCNFAQTPYRELAGVQPHLLLADFVKAFHPQVLPHYSPQFYKLIQ